MPKMEEIPLNDAQATPVTHTFVPDGPDRNQVFWLIDQSASATIGDWRISIGFRAPTSPSANGKDSQSAGRNYNIEIGLHEPVLETLSNSTITGITPSPTVSYIPRYILKTIMPERAVPIDRQNMRKMFKELLEDDQIIDILENNSRPY